MTDVMTEVARLRDMARTYQLVVIFVGLQLAMLWLVQPLLREIGPAGDVLIVIGWLGLVVALAIKGYQLAALLDRGAPAAWAAAMFIPLANFIALLLLSSNAQAICKRHGIRVGLLGPNSYDLYRLETGRAADPPKQ